MDGWLPGLPGAAASQICSPPPLKKTNKHDFSSYLFAAYLNYIVRIVVTLYSGLAKCVTVKLQISSSNVSICWPPQLFFAHPRIPLSLPQTKRKEKKCGWQRSYIKLQRLILHSFISGMHHWVLSAKRRHHSPEWTILSHVKSSIVSLREKFSDSRSCCQGELEETTWTPPYYTVSQKNCANVIFWITPWNVGQI